TKGALAALAVAIGVLHRLLDRLLGDADGVLAAAIVTLAFFRIFLCLAWAGTPRLTRAIDHSIRIPGSTKPGHEYRARIPGEAAPQKLRSPGIRSPGIGHVFLDNPRIAVAQHHRATRAADELGRPLDHAVTLALGLNFYLARAGHLEALLGAA